MSVNNPEHFAALYNSHFLQQTVFPLSLSQNWLTPHILPPICWIIPTLMEFPVDQRVRIVVHHNIACQSRPPWNNINKYFKAFLFRYEYLHIIKGVINGVLPHQRAELHTGMWHWDWALSYWEGQARKAVAKLICVMAGRQMLFRSVVTCLNKWMKWWREQLHFGPREMGVWHIEPTQHEGVWF